MTDLAANGGRQRPVTLLGTPKDPRRRRTQNPNSRASRADPRHGSFLRGWDRAVEPVEISQYRVAKATSVPPRRINEVVHRKRAITADTALRLARYFGTSERFWLNLQARYDLEVEKDRLGDRLAKEVILLARAS